MALYEQIFSDFKEGTINSFYQKMYPELLAYTIRLLGNEYAFLAEDCVQDAVFQSYQRHQSFASAMQWKVFLYTCTRNGAINILRKGQAQRNYQAQIDDFQDDISLDFIKQETLTLLYEAIEALPEKYKAFFALSFEQGLKNSEIAEYFQIAEITVKKKKARIIKLLHNNLKGKMEKDASIFTLVLFHLWLTQNDPTIPFADKKDLFRHTTLQGKSTTEIASTPLPPFVRPKSSAKYWNTSC